MSVDAGGAGVIGRLRCASRPTALAAAAVLWGLVVIGLGIALPVITTNSDHGGLQPRHSLVREYGYGVLFWLAIPLVVCVVVLVLLELGSRRRSRALGRTAMALSAVLALAALIGFVTIIIGVYVFPCAIFLVGACLAYRNDMRGPSAAQQPWPPIGPL